MKKNTTNDLVEELGLLEPVLNGINKYYIEMLNDNISDLDKQELLRYMLDKYHQDTRRITQSMNVMLIKKSGQSPIESDRE